MEIRLKDIKISLDEEQRKIGGYINVVERESETLYSKQRGKWFKEVMKAGVFTRALQKNSDIPLLMEHNWSNQLARTSLGTLDLIEDSIGLRFDAIVTQDVFEDIKRRNIKSCSFGFKVNEQSFEEINPKLEKRYVTNIDLLEVSLVENPAYTGSLVEQRNLEEALKKIEEQEVIEDKNIEKQIKEQKEIEETKDVQEAIQDDKESIEASDEKNEEVIEEEERNSEINTQEAKEIIEEVIKSKEEEIQYIEEELEYIKESKKYIEEDEMELTFDVYKKWLEIAKLKQFKNNL